MLIAWSLPDWVNLTVVPVPARWSDFTRLSFKVMKYRAYRTTSERRDENRARAIVTRRFATTKGAQDAAHIRGRAATGAARNLAASFSAAGTACAKNFLSPGQR